MVSSATAGPSSMLSGDPLSMVLDKSVDGGVVPLALLSSCCIRLLLKSFGCERLEQTSLIWDDEGANEVEMGGALKSSDLEENADCIDAACCRKLGIETIELPWEVKLASSWFVCCCCC